ncbi:MAG: hypothetical protein ACRCWQ_10225 [Bacilli bacterium]
MDPGLSLDEYRRKWLSHGTEWSIETKKPFDWDVEAQFQILKEI